MPSWRSSRGSPLGGSQIRALTPAARGTGIAPTPPVKISLLTTVAVGFLSLAPISARAALPTRGPWIQDAQSTQITVAWEAPSAGGTQSIAYGLGTATDQ